MEKSRGTIVYENDDRNKALFKWKRFVILFLCLVNGCTIAICLLLAFKGKVKHGKGTDTLVTATSFYWHFVDGIWLLVLSLIYILPVVY